MKQQILEKLFSGQELENEELMYVVKNLAEGSEEKEVSYNTSILPYNHKSKDIFEACGLTKEDGESLNKEFAKHASMLKPSHFSEVVEVLENFISDKPKYQRLLIFQSVQQSEASKLKESILRRLLGGDSPGEGGLGL